MGQKTSKDRSKKGKEPSANEASTAQSKFAIYLLAKNDEATLLQAQVSVAAFGSNAVLLSPDFHNASSSSSGTRKYNTYVIVDGHWLPERDENGRRTSERKTKSINFNLSSAKLVAVQQDIQLISPNTPKYQNILNATLSFFGVQQLSQLEKLPDVIHQNIIAAQYDKKSFIVAKGLSTILHRMYKPAEKSIIARTLLEHVIRGEQKRAEDLLNKLVKTNPDIFPELFTLKIKVKDDAGREFEKNSLSAGIRWQRCKIS